MIRSYLDNAATTPVDPRVADAVDAAQRSNFGNASSLHSQGREARRLVENAREEVASRLSARSREIVFTSSGTEANNLGVLGLAAAADQGRRRILCSAIEHPSVRSAAEQLGRSGFVVEWLHVDADGVLDIEQSAELLGDDVALSAVMYANNEVGSIQPLEQWAGLCLAAGVPLHCDGVQAYGKIPLTLPDGVTTFSLSAHKIHGPKGAAALYVRRETRLKALMLGGGQERDRRAGTENVPGVVGLGEASRLAHEEMEIRRQGVLGLESRTLEGLARMMPGAILNASGARRIPGLLNICFPGLYGETALMSLDLKGIAVSLGSACSSGSIEASHVLKAMGLSLEQNHSSLRVSFSGQNTIQDVDRFLDAVCEIRTGDR